MRVAVITKNNVIEIVKAGRMRQKIENEGFNTQKNLGYQLKHKFSRTSFNATQNYYQALQIAHLINQIVILNSKFKELVHSSKTTISFLWEQLRGYLSFVTINKTKIRSYIMKRVKFSFI